MRPSSGVVGFLRAAPWSVPTPAQRSDRRAPKPAPGRPELEVYLPEQAREPLPLLLALHGNLHNAARELGRWSGLLAHGWLVASAQSSQIAGPGRYVWTDRDKAERELKAHYDALRDEYPIEAGHFVVGGFSMGAETALALTLRRVLPAMALSPCAGRAAAARARRDRRPAQAPLPSGCARIVIGTMTRCREATTLARKLESAGFRCACRYEAGARLPADFAQRLPG